MDKNILEQLQGVLNTLSQISTKGQDSVYMGSCLMMLGNIIENAAKDTKESEPIVSEPVTEE